MKKLIFLLVSMIAITATAQVRTAVVAAEKQLQNPRVMVNTRVRVNSMPTYRNSYALPYAGIAAHSYATYNNNNSSVSEDSDPLIWPYVMLGVGALGLVYLVFTGFYEKKNQMTAYKWEPNRAYHQANEPQPYIVELANGGGVLVRG